MDFNKYLPKYLVIKNVFNFENSTVHKYFISSRDELNMKYFNHDRILSWHPLIIRDGNNFYYFKGLNKTDFLLAKFCLNNEMFDPSFNNNILDNYFKKNSFEL